MQISSNKGFCSFTLDSTHEKFDVWNGPNIRIHELAICCLWLFTSIALNKVNKDHRHCIKTRRISGCHVTGQCWCLFPTVEAKYPWDKVGGYFWSWNFSNTQIFVGSLKIHRYSIGSRCRCYIVCLYNMHRKGIPFNLFLGHGRQW